MAQPGVLFCSALTSIGVAHASLNSSHCLRSRQARSRSRPALVRHPRMGTCINPTFDVDCGQSVPNPRIIPRVSAFRADCSQPVANSRAVPPLTLIRDRVRAYILA